MSDQIMRSSVGIAMLVGQLGSRLIARGQMSPRLEREEGARSSASCGSSCRLKTLSILCTFLASLISSFGMLSLNTLAYALDGQQYPATAKAPLSVFKNPRQAQQHGIDLYRAGEIESSLEALKYAADGGQPVAQWKLGRMYADGDGVGRDDIKAYHYFFRIVETFDEDEITAREIPFVANAFVAIGVYSLQGIPNSIVKRDTSRAFEMFQYAAMNFGDPAAQFNLARMYLEGEGLPKDSMQAIKWLSAAAEKSHMPSQALLGKLLFNGHDGIAPQRARGLMLLTLARDAASRDKQDVWVIEAYQAAIEGAAPLDREMALKYLDGHLKQSALAQNRR